MIRDFLLFGADPVKLISGILLTVCLHIPEQNVHCIVLVSTFVSKFETLFEWQCFDVSRFPDIRNYDERRLEHATNKQF